MDTPPGQDPQPFQQQPDAPPTVVSVSGPSDTADAPGWPEPRRLVAAGLAELAMVLTLAGCFFPLLRTEHRIGSGAGETMTIVAVQDAWETRFLQDTGPAFAVATSPFGVPLLVAAAVLLAVGLFSARAARLRQPGTFDRWFATIGAVFLIGVTGTLSMLILGRQLGETAESTMTPEAGMWALIAAVVAAVGAAVMSHRVEEDEVLASGDSSLADLPTPKEGFSITVLPPGSPPRGTELVPSTDTPSPRPPSGPPDYSAFAPPPDPDPRERD